jgi:hypothetical protein
VVIVVLFCFRNRSGERVTVAVPAIAGLPWEAVDASEGRSSACVRISMSSVLDSVPGRRNEEALEARETFWFA